MNDSQNKAFQLFFKKAEKWVIDRLVPILLVYFFVSVFYQASSFWLDNTLYSKVEKISNRCFELRLRLPNQIPLSSPNGDNNGKPITVWGWKTSNLGCPDQELTVNLSNHGELVFTDSEQTETASSLLVVLGDNEAEASRYTVFMFSPLSQKRLDEVQINVSVYGEFTKDQQPYILNAQSELSFALKKLLDIVFGTTVFTIISIAFAVGKYFYEEQSKRRDEEKKLFDKKIGDLENYREGLGKIVNNLLPEAKRLDKQNDLLFQFQKVRRDLNNEFIWSLSLRGEIAASLQEADFEGYLLQACKNLKYPDQDRFNDLIAFSHIVRGGPDVQDEFTRCELERSLRAFRFLGFISKETIIGYLKRCKDKIRTADWLQDWYYDKENGATGRYLLRQIADPNLQSQLDEWERRNPSPPNRISASYSLWSPKMPFVSSGGMAADLPEPKDWRHPFGPTKAEDDPRLPPGESKADDRPVKALFWENKPSWDKVSSAESTCFYWDKVSSAESACFYMSPGMGMSALILMGRHERRFWGKKPSFSLYIPIHGKPERESFHKSFEKALGRAVLLGTVEDPFWLLGAPEGAQEEIGAFLLHWAGNDLARLLRRLAEAGLPEGEQLLAADMLYMASQAQPYQPSLLKDLIQTVVTQMGNAAFIRTLGVEPFKMYIWIEIKDDAHAQEWLDLFAAEGLAGMGILKIFIRKLAKKERGSLFADKIRASVLLVDEWKENDLIKLLEYRMDCVWNKSQKSNLISKSEIKIKTLIKKAEGSPQRLIQLGNENFFEKKQG